MNRKYYRSNRSIIVGIILWGIISFTYTRAWFAAGPSGFTLAESISLIAILAFVSLVWFGLGYRIKDETLEVRIGPILFRRIAIKEITAIDRSYNPLSSPAASLRRIRIIGSGDDILISPAREKEFVDQLKNINSGIDCDLNLLKIPDSRSKKLIDWLL